MHLLDRNRIEREVIVPHFLESREYDEVLIDGPDAHAMGVSDAIARERVPLVMLFVPLHDTRRVCPTRCIP